MSKEIQRSLGLPVPPASRDRNRVKSVDRRLQVLGRPRRLKPTFQMSPSAWRKVYKLLNEGEIPEIACSEFSSDPAIIKISVTQPVLAALDRICKKIEGNATLPDLIRIAVDRFIANPPESVEIQEKKAQRVGRCKYPKVLFEPSALAAIGHQETDEPAYGLCAKLNLTRQQVINLAILEYLKEVS